MVEKLGFSQGLACPCIFVQESKDIVVTVHGDDFTAVGPKSSLDWYEDQLKSLYELKVGGRLGPGKTTTGKRRASTVLSVGPMPDWNTKLTHARRRS